MTENEIRQNVDKVDWDNISANQTLSEELIREFIREFQDKVNWYNISYRQTLSEEFIREFKDKVYWDYISSYQTLSEDFIREFQDKVDWYNISQHQVLSEDFIREFQNKVNWKNISYYQTLSEDFIREFQDKVDWLNISKFQTLSEDFIREFQNKVNWKNISYYQTLSEDFIKEFNLKVDPNSWINKPKKFKLQKLREHGNYEIIDEKYILAYKSTRKNGRSVFDPAYQYLVGKTYEAKCDCTLEENSFGLSAWTKEKALDYYSKGELYLIKILIDDIGVLLDNGKIRAKKIEILERLQ